MHGERGMTTGDLTLKWMDSPIIHEMRLKLRQREASDALPQAVIYVKQAAFDELVEILPPEERYTVYQGGETMNMIFMGYILQPY